MGPNAYRTVTFLLSWFFLSPFSLCCTFLHYFFYIHTTASAIYIYTYISTLRSKTCEDTSYGTRRMCSGPPTWRHWVSSVVVALRVVPNTLTSGELTLNNAKVFLAVWHFVLIRRFLIQIGWSICRLPWKRAWSCQCSSKRHTSSLSLRAAYHQTY